MERENNLSKDHFVSIKKVRMQTEAMLSASQTAIEKLKRIVSFMKIKTDENQPDQDFSKIDEEEDAIEKLEQHLEQEERQGASIDMPGS